MTADPAGDASLRLLAALAGRYGTGEFAARDAAGIPRALWEAVGVPRPDAGSCGRWLRARKGRDLGSVALANRHDRDGVSLWRLRRMAGDAPAGRAGSGGERREALSPKAGVGKPAMTGGSPHPPPPAAPARRGAAGARAGPAGSPAARVVVDAPWAVATRWRGRGVARRGLVDVGAGAGRRGGAVSDRVRSGLAVRRAQGLDVALQELNEAAHRFVAAPGAPAGGGEVAARLVAEVAYVGGEAVGDVDVVAGDLAQQGEEELLVGG